MPAWVEQISANYLGTYGAAFIGFLVAILLIILIFRLLFGHRLRMQSSRQRLARLGIVDAFSLDRQRQLVIVRRDNVEHLILIGGPNDLLIESEIIRAEARDSRDQRAREKDPRERESKEIGGVVPLNGTVRVPLAAAVSPANFPAEETTSYMTPAVAEPKPEAPLPASAPVPVLSAVPPLATQPAFGPGLSARPSPRAKPEGLDLPAKAQPPQTAAEPASTQARIQSPQPGIAADKQATSPTETSPIPRPAAAPFTLTPRPNPFPIPPRRAPVTTPLPKPSIPREPANGAQTEQGDGTAGVSQTAGPKAKIEPSFTPRPSFLRTPFSYTPPSSLKLPLSGADVPPPQGSVAAEEKQLEVPQQIKEAAPVNAGHEAILPLPPEVIESLATASPIAATASTPADQASKIAKPELQAPDNNPSLESKVDAETKQLSEANSADSLNSLEAEMAKLLGRE